MVIDFVKHSRNVLKYVPTYMYASTIPFFYKPLGCLTILASLGESGTSFP